VRRLLSWYAVAKGGKNSVNNRCRIAFGRNEIEVAPYFIGIRARRLVVTNEIKEGTALSSHVTALPSMMHEREAQAGQRIHDQPNRCVSSLPGRHRAARPAAF
jgi:hypothetical protein